MKVLKVTKMNKWLRNTLVICTQGFFIFFASAAKVNCNELIKDQKAPAIRAYIKLQCPDLNIAFNEQETKWFNMLAVLKGDLGAWNEANWNFDHDFGTEFIDLYDFVQKNKLNLKRGSLPLLKTPIVEIWEVISKQAKQKQNRDQIENVLRLAIRTYACGDGSWPEDILAFIAEELEKDASVVMRAIQAEQRSLDTSNPQSTCGKKLKAEDDQALYANMILKGMGEMYWQDRSQIPIKVVDQFGQLYKTFSASSSLQPFRDFYDSYKDNEVFEQKPVRKHKK